MLQLVTDRLAGGEPQGVDADNIVLTKDNIEQFVKDHPELVK